MTLIARKTGRGSVPSLCDNTHHSCIHFFFNTKLPMFLISPVFLFYFLAFVNQFKNARKVSRCVHPFLLSRCLKVTVNSFCKLKKKKGKKKRNDGRRGRNKKKRRPRCHFSLAFSIHTYFTFLALVSRPIQQNHPCPLTCAVRPVEINLDEGPASLLASNCFIY